MSRIGKMPVSVPAGVEVKIGDGVIDVKGPNGHVSTPVCDMLDYEMKDGAITLTRKDDSRESNAQHGLRRELLRHIAPETHAHAALRHRVYEHIDVRCAAA